jgi:hypothetical protein
MADGQPTQDENWFPLPVPVPGPTKYTELGLRPDATSEEIRVATARQARALKSGGAPQDQLADFNATSLTHTDHRAAHDQEHPPCGLLRLEPTWSPLFDDPEKALARLRRDLEAFLLAPDERERPIPFPRSTDLYRGDFSDDFRFHPLLDRKDIG